MTACTGYDTRQGSTSSSYNNTQYDNRYEGRYGNISRIETFKTSSRTSGGGAILGALVGGAIGTQIGDGDGRTVATVVGAVGGALAGNAIEKHNKADNEFFRISIRFDNGSTAQYDYQNIGYLQVGDRVRVTNGQVYKM